MDVDDLIDSAENDLGLSLEFLERGVLEMPLRKLGGL